MKAKKKLKLIISNNGRFEVTIRYRDESLKDISLYDTWPNKMVYVTQIRATRKKAIAILYEEYVKYIKKDDK